MNRILFSGYYGMENFGDDLFCTVASIGASRYWGENEPRLPCPPVHRVEAVYGYPGWLPKRWFANKRKIGSAIRIAAFANAMRGGVDRLVYGGGSVFYSGDGGPREHLARRMSPSLRRWAIGVSIGPFASTEAERKVVERLKAFEFIAVRDKASMDRVSAFNLDARLVQSADLAGVYPYPGNDSVTRGERHPETGFRIGFAPCYRKGAEPTSVSACDAFVDAVKHTTRERAARVVLFCLNERNPNEDLALVRYTRERLDEAGIPCGIRRHSEEGIQGVWSGIARTDFFFSVRLHGAIAAYLCEIPFFLFEYHPKCSEFLDFVGKDKSERVDQECGPKSLSEVAEKLLEKPSKCRMPTGDYRALSERNFTEAPD